MALRPIDNALPTTPERPKKQPKIAVAVATQQQENQQVPVPLPSSGDATVDYISSGNLQPISDPEAKIQVSIKNSIFFLFPFFRFWHY